jgi:Flp pilus assembly pilin Flp
MESQSSKAGDQRRFRGDAGASLVEYALLTALIAVVCIVALVYFQKETSASLSRSSSAISNAGT